jgi:hypothetical protein
MAQTHISQAISRPWWTSVAYRALVAAAGIITTARPAGSLSALALVVVMWPLIRASSASSTRLIFARRDAS